MVISALGHSSSWSIPSPCPSYHPGILWRPALLPRAPRRQGLGSLKEFSRTPEARPPPVKHNVKCCCKGEAPSEAGNTASVLSLSLWPGCLFY